MSRSKPVRTIEVFEGELFTSGPPVVQLGVVRCYEFEQEPNQHLHKLDGTEVTESGRITCKFETKNELDQNARYLIRLAGQTNTVLIEVECVGLTSYQENVYEARGIEALLTQ